MNPKRIIITGAPGTGKTTLLRYLESKGSDIVHEPARLILAEHRGVPADVFTRLLLERAIFDWKRTTTSQGPVIFDRGVPDLITYAGCFQLEDRAAWQAALEYRYDPRVFICPPWESIFVNDTERTLSFRDAVAFHDSLVKSYRELGYELMELPKGPVDERAQFFMERF